MGADGPDLAETFGSLANPTRVAILRALKRAHDDAPTDPWVAYADLQEAVGVRDNGNFNYHLRELDGFLEKTPAGYTLTRSGIELLSAAAAGRFDGDRALEPVEVPGECPFCSRNVELRYEDEVLWLTCGDDEHAMGLWASPALLATRSDDDIVDRVAFLGNRWAATTRRGICAACQGHADGRLAYGGHQPDHYHYRAECHRCGTVHGIPLGLYLLGHPVVWAFYDDHGGDARTTPFWTLNCAAPDAGAALSTEPLRVRVALTHGGEQLRLDVDAEGSIVATDRS